MEELKLLVQMVADLPSMALWVIAFFFIYKIAIIGSVYGVIRYTVEKIHSWLTTPKHTLEIKEVRPMLDGFCITGQLDAFIAQLHRVRGRGLGPSFAGGLRGEYIHHQSVEWLREAIDDRIAKDEAKH